MRPIRFPRLRATLLAAAALTAPPLLATTVLQMNLGELCSRADRIYRGTVVSVDSGTVEAGGAALPTVTYRLKVTEQFRGRFTPVKGQRLAEITMLSSKQAPRGEGGLRSFPVLRDLPTLRLGESYLLIATAPSPVGLSTTVGLGQGCFHISGKGDQETAVNEVGNRGLLADHSGGPIAYSTLASRIRAALGR